MTRILMTLALSLTLLGSFGCKSTEEKFCTHMREIYGEKMNDCEKDALPEVKAKCKDPEAVMKCMLDSTDKDGADKCYKEKCEKK